MRVLDLEVYSPNDAMYVNTCHISSVVSVSFQPGIVSRPSAMMQRFSPLFSRSAALSPALVRSDVPGNAPDPSAPWHTAQA